MGPDAALAAVLRRASPFWRSWWAADAQQGRQNRGSGGIGAEVPPWPEGLAAPDVLGAAHEALLTADRRRTLGAHLTPPSLASALVAWAVEEREGEWRVHDPAVGAGAFLLAAARHQTRRGADPVAVLAGLSGSDLDPRAVDVARASLALWAVEQGVGPDVARSTLCERIVVGDGLLTDPPGDAPDLVAGNPPFLGQLRSDTARDRILADALRERLGAAATGLVDAAALFLLAGARAVRPGGRVVLVVPLSLLGTEHGAAARAAVEEVAEVAGLWVAGERVFAADVEVGALLLQAREGRVRETPPARPVRLARGAEVTAAGSAVPTTGPSWAPLLAAVHGVPPVVLDASGGTVGDRAEVVAGFRQHFYALADHVAEVPDPAEGSDLTRLATTGLVDPLHLAWGERPARVSGRTWFRPGVALDAVAAADAEVASWMRARLRPKLLVAPQAKVVEVAIDPAGDVLPGVPLVSVEPGRESDGSDAPDVETELWRLAAVLSSPAVTAWVLHRAAGTGRAPTTARVGVATVRAVPLPVDEERWHRVADDLRSGRPLLDAGPDLATAHGLRPDDPVVAWWAARLPIR